MKFENRKGSILVLTLMIFSVLMIFGAVGLNLMVNENKQALWHENHTKAYYLARSGAVAVEAAIEKYGIEGIIDLKDMDISGNKLTEGNETITVSLIQIKGNVKIVSTGNVNGVTNEVIRILVETEGEPGLVVETLDFKYAIYSKALLDLNNITVTGDVASGKGIENSDKVTGNKTTYLNIYYPPLKYPSKQFPEKPDFSNKGNEYDIIIRDSATVTGDIYLNSTDDIKIGNSATVTGNIYLNSTDDIKIGNSATITGNIYSYSTADIEIGNSKTITGDIYLNSTDHIIIGDSATITGNIYSNSTADIKIGKSATITGNIYSNSTDHIIIDDSATVTGNIYSNSTADIKIGNKATITGNIYSNSKAEFEIGNKTTITGLIYAPKLDLVFKTGTITGAIVVNSIKSEYNLKITYAKLKSLDPSITNPSTGINNKYEGHFK